MPAYVLMCCLSVLPVMLDISLRSVNCGRTLVLRDDCVSRDAADTLIGEGHCHLFVFVCICVPYFQACVSVCDCQVRVEGGAGLDDKLIIFET